MNILVIGNGFDLAHGLSTKYIDFLNCMKIIKTFDSPNVSKNFIRRRLTENEEFKDMNSYLKKFLLKDELYDPSSRSETIVELMELVNDNVWLEYFFEKKDNENKGWIDFESEIAKIIQAYDYIKGCNYHELKSNKDYDEYDEYDARRENEAVKFIGIYNKLFKVINGGNICVSELYDGKLDKFIKHLNGNLNDLIRCLEIYLFEFIEIADVESRLSIIDKIKVDKVLSFNYTNTYERIYGRTHNIDEYDYIHGNVDISRRTDENNMVLGIDEYLEKDRKDNDIDFIMFKKYFQRIYKKTGNAYQKWIKKIKVNKVIVPDSSGRKTHREQYYSNLYIIGHSLDVTDKDIFNQLILTEKMLTTVFYHDEKSHASLIANMVKIIGQDELIKRVCGEYPIIKFSKLQ